MSHENIKKSYELRFVEGRLHSHYEVIVTVELGYGMKQYHTHRFATKGEALCWIKHCL